MATFNSAGSGNANADATWTESGQPATGDHCIIASGHTVTLTADELWGSVSILGELAGGGYTLTLDDGGDAYIINNDGEISGTLNVVITGTTNRHIDLAATGGANNLTINASSTTFNLAGGGTHLVGGTLTLTAGALTTGNDCVLTVTGDAIITSGTTFTGNDSATISFGSLTVEGTYSATSATTIITSERSNGRAIDIVGTYTHNSGTLKIQTAADTDLRCPSSSSLNHLIIDHASCIARPTGNNKPPIAGNLTINQGKYSLLDSDGSSTHQSTVTGDVIIGDGSGSANTAIFEGRDDSVTFGSLTIDSDGHYDATSGTTTITSEKTSSGYAWYNVSGTFTHNNGTVNFTSTADTHLRDDTFYNLTITGGASSSDFYYRPKDGGVGAVTIANDLTIVEGLFRPAGAAGTLTVTGDVSIESGGVLGQEDSSGAMTFGSVTIASGGTYLATSGTTKLTGKNGSNYMLQNSGTFTHNKGTVRFEADTSSGTWYATSATNVEADSIKFYNLETVRTGSAGSYRFFVGGNSFYLVVLNNLTIGVNTNIHSSNGTSILRHYGPLFNIEGSAGFDNVTDVQCGFITIGSAGIIEFDSGDQAISCTGIRNLRGSAGIQA